MQFFDGFNRNVLVQILINMIDVAKQHFLIGRFFLGDVDTLTTQDIPLLLLLDSRPGQINRIR